MEQINNKKVDVEKYLYDLDSVEDIKTALQKLPGIIRLKQENIFNQQNQKAELLKKTKTIEEDCKRIVRVETIEVEKDGKTNAVKKYKNDFERESAVNSILLNNLEYNKLRDAADKIDESVRIAEMDLSYIKRINTNAGYIVLLGGQK